MVPLDILKVLSLAFESVKNAREIEPKNSISIAALKWEIYSCLQNMLDSIAMIVVDLGLVKPSTYGDLGLILREKGIIDDEAVELIKKAAATRNLIAHAYRRVDIKELMEIVNNLLPKIEELCSFLTDYVKKSKLDPEITCPIACTEVFKRNNVKLVYLFGSRARIVSREGSDYDFAVLLGREATLEDEIKLTLELADALKVPVDMVDVTVLDKADLGIIYRVLKEGKLVYAYDDNVRRMWEKSALFKIMESREIYDINIKR